VTDAGWLFVVLPLAASVAGYWARSMYFSTPTGILVRRMRQVPVRRIAEAREGEKVRIVGRVGSHEQLLTAPLTDRPCLAHEVVVTVENAFGLASHEMETEALPMTIRDETGVAHLGPGEPALALAFDRVWTYTRAQQGPEKLDRLLDRHQRHRQAHEGFRWTRVREGTLQSGDEIAVVGTARWQDDPDGMGGSYREAPRRLVLEDCIVSNDPRARR
jgi:hypothetical protein